MKPPLFKDVFIHEDMAVNQACLFALECQRLRDSAWYYTQWTQTLRQYRGDYKKAGKAFESLLHSSMLEVTLDYSSTVTDVSMGSKGEKNQNG
jgi:hypothetical protein